MKRNKSWLLWWGYVVGIIITVVSSQSIGSDDTSCINSASLRYPFTGWWVANYTGAIGFLGWSAGGAAGKGSQFGSGAAGAYAAFIFNVTQGQNYTIQIGGGGQNLATFSGGSGGGGSGGTGNTNNLGGGGGGYTGFLRSPQQLHLYVCGWLHWFIMSNRHQ